MKCVEFNEEQKKHIFETIDLWECTFREGRSIVLSVVELEILKYSLVFDKNRLELLYDMQDKYKRYCKE